MHTKRMLAQGLVGLAAQLLWQAATLGAPARPPAGPPPSPPAADARPVLGAPTPADARPVLGAPAPADARPVEGAPAPADAASRPRPTNGAPEEPPPDAVAAPPEGAFYRRIDLEVTGLLWLEPGQRGLIEAHPLVMGLAAMAFATVALLFFFLRGVKRPKDEDF